MKNSDTTLSLSDLYSCFKDKSRKAIKIKTITNYLSKPIECNMLPSGFEPEITALRGQYAWPDYTTGACKNENQLQFKAIAIFRKPPVFTLMVKSYHFETLYKI